MNTNTNDQHAWSDLKKKIKSKWSKFTDQDIDSVKGNMDQLKHKIQHTYGVPQERAEREFNEFQNSLRTPAHDGNVSQMNRRPAQEDNRYSTSEGNRRSPQEDDRRYSGQEPKRGQSEQTERQDDERTQPVGKNRSDRPAKSA